MYPASRRPRPPLPTGAPTRATSNSAGFRMPRTHTSTRRGSTSKLPRGVASPWMLPTGSVRRSIPAAPTPTWPRAAFALIQPNDTRGNLGFNTFRRGGIRNMNAALARSWPLRSETNLTFRAESINFFNTPQFADPNPDLSSPAFGKITNTLNDGRSFQFTLQLQF